MAIYDLFSKRENRALGVPVDVYKYDDIPDKLKVQIVYIWNEALGTARHAKTLASSKEAYTFLVDAFRKELGVFCLIPGENPDYIGSYEEIVTFFTSHASGKQCVDIIEIAFRIIDRGTRSYEYFRDRNYNERADEAIADLNTRFKENGVGYQYVAGDIIRLDSELLHAEAVKPALAILNSRDYKGPQEEFLKAYDHYKSGNNKEALNDCLKAFESTMKAICDKRGWTYDASKDTAKKLIEILFDKGLIPSFWQTQFASLRSLLESSVPTGRNRMAGHGQGATPTEVPNEITAYMLHMTASTLVFLTTAEKALP